MKLKTNLMVGAALLLGAVASNANAGDITSLSQPNFSSENGGNPTLNYYGFANFTVGTSPASGFALGGSVDLIGNGSFDVYPGNGLYVDMCGTTSVCGSLTSKSAFAAGTYDVTIKLGGQIYGGGVPDGVNVSFGSLSQNDVLPALQVQTFSGVATLASAGYLTISDLNLTGNQNIGSTLFSVSVSPVPLPAALPLFGVAIAGLGVYGRRRARKTVA